MVSKTMLCDCSEAVNLSDNSSKVSGYVHSGSWFCLTDVPFRGWDKPSSFFLYLQDFNATPHARWLLGAVIAFVCLLGLPINGFVAYNFWRNRNVTKQFFILATSLAICNAVFCASGIVHGAQIAFIDPLFNCSIIMYLSIVTCMIYVALSLLISLERRLCVLSSVSGIAKQMTPRQVWFSISAIVLSISLAWSPIFFYTDMINATVNNEPVQTCVILFPRVGQTNTSYLAVVSGIFTVLTVCLAGPMIILNYWSIYWAVRSAGSETFKVSALSVNIRNRQRDVFLAKIMFATIVIFLASTTSYSLAITMTFVDDSCVLSSSWSALATLVKYIGLSFGPLIQLVRPKIASSPVTSTLQISSN